MRLASYKRDKDKETQWYTYDWKFNENEYKKLEIFSDNEDPILGNTSTNQSPNFIIAAVIIETTTPSPILKPKLLNLPLFNFTSKVVVSNNQKFSPTFLIFSKYIIS